MSDRHETITDIVAMLRANARGDRFDGFSYTSLADRIDAAVKRDVKDATLRGIQAAKKSFYEVIDEIGPLYSTEPIGDVAKLREALIAIKALTESHAHELNELGTIYRTAKAFLEGETDGNE